MTLFNSRLFIYFSILAAVAFTAVFSTAYAQPCFLAGGKAGNGEEESLPQIATPLPGCIERPGFVTTATLDLPLSDGSDQHVVFWSLKACQEVQKQLVRCSAGRHCTLVNTSILWNNPYVIDRGSACNRPIAKNSGTVNGGQKGATPIKKLHDDLDFARGSRYGEAVY